MDALREGEEVRRREDRQALLLVLVVLCLEGLRRLKVLNHAHEEAVEVQHTYVTQEKFDDFVDREAENRSVVAKALTLAEGKGLGMAQLWAIVATMLLIAVGLVAALNH
jgi:hypothetical protein